MKLYYLLLSVFLPIILLSMGIIGFFSYNKHKNTLIASSLDNVSMNIVMEQDDLNSFLHHAEDDVMFLSELSSLKELINSEDEDAIKTAKFNLEQDLLSFSDNKKIYYQVRYIDESGQEVVRIDSDGSKIKIIKEENLQNKKGRYYFDDAMKVDRGSIFISPLDLNIENGEIEDRGFPDSPEYVPVIRYATPVFDEQKTPKGIVLTNIYADQFLNNLDEEGRSFLLVNKDGFYLSHPEKNKEWGFMFENDETIQKDYPNMAQKLFTNDSGQLLDDSGSNYFTFSKVHVAEGDYAEGDEVSWVLLSVDSRDSILEPVVLERKNGMIIGSIIFFVISFLILFISKLISKPINNLTKVAEQISKGKLDVKIEEKILNSKSEVGDLARAFERIFISLKLAMRDKSQKDE